MTVLNKKLSLPSKEQALPGRDETMPVTNRHYVSGLPIMPAFSEDDSRFEVIYLGLGCFWGAERKYWQMPGVLTTAVGYMAGHTPNPTYEEVCSGLTGHNEVVMVVYEPSIISVKVLLSSFFEMHDPTQGMRQGNDRGTQYRSGIYVTTPEQQSAALALKRDYQASLHANQFGDITTEILSAPAFYYAEDYHQQYLAKNPNGYCGIGGTGVACTA